MMRILSTHLYFTSLEFSSSTYYPCNPSLEDELRRLFADYNFIRYSPPPTVPNAHLRCRSPLRQNFVRDCCLCNKQNIALHIMDEFRANGRDSEYCPELEGEEVPVQNVRRKKNRKPLPSECVFCKNNGENAFYYRNHYLKDNDGVIKCPVLRAYTCPLCGANGDYAHTIKYCPLNRDPEEVSIIKSLRNRRNSVEKRRRPRN